MAQFAEESFTRLAETTNDPGADANRLLVRFYIRPVKNETLSEKEGRPIFEDREYVTIAVPGDKDNIIDRAVWEQDRQRFPQHYAKFKQGLAVQDIGTPLEAWPPISRAQVEELKYFNIKTVEQLAGLSDEKASRHMGLQGLKKQAADFLAMASGNSHLHKMRAEIEQRDGEIASMKAMLKDLSDKYEALQKKK